jgi:anaerobic magnesium-protoporphyrin IX monomethyl ester cyclase
MSSAPIQLAVPPHADLTQPAAGTAALSAYLRREARLEVAQTDESILAFEYFTRPERLRLALGKALEVRARLEARRSLGFLEQQRYLAVAKAALCGEYAIENAAAAKAVLRGPDFHRPEKYSWAVGVLQRCLGLISAEFFRTRLSLEDLHLRFRWRSSTDLRLAAFDEAENPYLEYFRSATLPRMRAASPEILGLSVTHGAQLAAAYTLARLVREALPSCKVLMGGALMPHIAHGLARNRSLFEWVDAYVIGDGEEALKAYSESRRDPEALREVPNLMYLDPRSGEIVRNARRDIEDLDRLPPPDFSGLPLPLYLSPSPVLPLAPSRGCYWERCAFCSRKGPYREKSARALVSELEHLGRAHGARHFFFAVDVLSPRALVRFAQAIEEAGVEAAWSSDLRAERTLDDRAMAQLSRGGCREIRIGLESGSARVLRLLDKGIDIAQVERILLACRRHGIGTRLALFFGFPSEDEAEAGATVELIRRLWDLIDEIDVTYFALERGSEVHRAPAAFGVTRILEDEHMDLAMLLRCEVAPGPSMTEVMERFTRAKAQLDRLPRGHRTRAVSKAHSLLFFSRTGREASAQAPLPELDPGKQEIVRSAADVRVLQLAFDLRELEHAVYRADCRLNHMLLEQGRPLADIVAELDASEPHVAARPQFVLYQGTKNRLSPIGPAAAEVLLQCRASSSQRELSRHFAQRLAGEQLDRTLARLRAAGLVTFRTAEREEGAP